jgi:SagB-type dehydrogenase family enzyme
LPSSDLDRVLGYHERTRHSIHAMAKGPGSLDWACQPDPFRSYEGSSRIRLRKIGFVGRSETPAGLDLDGISRLFFESLALSAKKSFAGTSWSLRVNPSSGNLHPTESYLITGPVAGLEDLTGLYHYSSRDHALEFRGRISAKSWEALDLPEGSILIALSSIYWRESWKYGERAFRYCHLDVGHALAALAYAASCLGWQCALQENTGTADLIDLLGLEHMQSLEEVERPDCLLAVFPAGISSWPCLSSSQVRALSPAEFRGRPNLLSHRHVDWSAIGEASDAASTPPDNAPHRRAPSGSGLWTHDFCRILRQRRSAQAMDGKTTMPLADFCRILRATLADRVPFSLLPWDPMVNLVLFLHRVEDLGPGLYLLVRISEDTERLVQAMAQQKFLWEKPAAGPADLDLYLLARGDARLAARRSSCNQDLASDGCFAVAMISRFAWPLESIGPWFYPRLHWECGMIGQALYLGAEAAGLRGCGIGCFFDQMVPDMLGLEGPEFRDLYHFAVGRPLDDPRLIALPGYDQDEEDERAAAQG